MQNYDVAELDRTEMQRLKELEDEFGNCLVAYEESDSRFGGSGATFARLSNDQLRRLQELENEFGAVLIAYECS